MHLWLAAAFGLKGNLDEAKTSLVQSLAIKPEINSLARLREHVCINNPAHWALREQTADIGLRRAGFPENKCLFPKQRIKR